MLLATMLLLAQAVDDRGKCEIGAPQDAAWFKPADYPRASLEAGEEGKVGYTVEVDSEGCVTACVVTATSGYKALDDGACAVLMRSARFRPARDAEGKRIAATYSSYYRWILPDALGPGAKQPEPRTPMASWLTNDDYPPAALRAADQGDVVFRLRIDETGAVTGCEVRESSGSPALDLATCSLMSRRGRFAPAEDAKGNAIPSHWSNAIRWRLP